MKKIIITFSLMALLVFSLQAQAIDYSDYEDGFEDFATEVAKSLPFTAAVGLNWSDAYIGHFPHFGVGITVGATSVPYDAMKPVFEVLGASLGGEMDFIETWGAPFPAYTIEGRVGGLILPFDAGVKIGVLPDDAKVLMPFNMDYLMVGGDVRYRILKSTGPLPEVSFGVGYTMLNGGITLPGILDGDQDITLTGIDTGGDASPDVLRLTDPDLNFNWQSHVIDFKIQASKKLLVITPHVGLGMAYGTSSAGGGAETDVLWSDNGTVGTFSSISQTQINQIISLYEAAGQTPPDLTTSGLLVESDTKGWAMRAFGGLSLNLLLKFDLSGMYNFTSGSLGGALNARIQL